MITINGLNKIYTNGTKAIDNLSLQIDEREILALLGPNGAGKSSTIKVLTTLSGFDDGKVTVAGYDIDREPEKVRQSIGYVAQETGVDYFLTGRENLELHGHLYRMKKMEIKARIEELAEYFELADVLDNLVSSYSGGMRRKLDIATALIHRPKILFLDEPTLGLDTQSRQSLWKYIRKLNEEFGLTILLTTHYLEEADKLSNRVAIIDKGRIKVIDKPDVLKDDISGDVVSLQIQDPQNKNDIVAKLRSNDFVMDTMWEKDKLHMYVSNGATSIPRLIENCNEINADVINVSYQRPTLDDVFIKYTGSSIDAGDDEEEKWWEKWAGKGGGGMWAKKWQQANAEAEDDEKVWTAEEAEEWHKEKEWSKDEAEAWDTNKKWSAEESAAWHANKEKQSKPEDTEKQWSAEETEEWHKNKQWSEKENTEWEDNKEWSEEESAKWHSDQQAKTAVTPIPEEKPADTKTSEKEWSQEESEQWDSNKQQWSAEEAAAWHSSKENSPPASNKMPDSKKS